MRSFVAILATFLLFAIVVGFPQNSSNRDDDLFELQVVHLNDFHARFEQTSPQSGECVTTDGKCIGGIARVYTAVQELLRNKTNAIFLNAGDNFQGTLWYNIFRGNVTQYFLNMFPTDVYTLGNHEFDHGVQGVLDFMRKMKATCVVANIDDSEEPDIQNLYQKSTVLVREGRKIGVVGVMLNTTNDIANTGKLKFLNEIETVNAEAARLVAEDDCDIVIVLSHCGLDVDIAIAANAGPRVGLIVGGHSHSLLYTGTPPSNNSQGQPDWTAGEYPVRVTNKQGGTVLVVQASAYTKYLGNIFVKYDEDGNVREWNGNTMYMSSEVVPDPMVERELEPWKEQIDAIGKEVLGVSNVELDSSKCRYAECNLGSFITDAFVHYYTSQADATSWTYAAIAITNPGGIRTNIPKGNVTLNALVAAQPFENTVDVGELQGRYIKEMLEYAATVGRSVTTPSNVNFLQMAGIKVVYDLNEEAGERAEQILVRCAQCLVPRYEPLDLNKDYRIAMPNFVAGGGDGYHMIRDNLKNHKVGPMDRDVLTDYIIRQSPITQEESGRIRIKHEDKIVLDKTFQNN